jgi:hypothetical protein
MGWADTYRTLGPKNFASYAFTRAIGTMPGIAYRRYEVIAVPRSGMPSMPRGHDVRPLRREELLHVRADLDLGTETIAYRSAQGMTCLGAFRGERLLGVTWLTDEPFDEDEIAVRYVPPPGAAWDTGLFVRREDRCGRGFAALWAGTAGWLRDRGLFWSMSRITDYNDGSRRAHARMGATCVDTLAALRVGDHQWLFGAHPRHVRLRPGTVPPVLLLPLPGTLE